MLELDLRSLHRWTSPGSPRRGTCLVMSAVGGLGCRLSRSIECYDSHGIIMSADTFCQQQC